MSEAADLMALRLGPPPATHAQIARMTAQLMGGMYMSWSASVSSHSRANFNAAVNSVAPSPTVLDEHMAKQFETAKEVIKTIASIIPGPMLSASMAGHANGVGDNPKPGWSNDYVTVTVSQVAP